ncbi:hypothetical protein VTK73DRAFT_5539 [Phialemonium thermophilum]|uniref:Glutamine amidotransferase domain-containing protein n=1 Tax=Phialemonium thermophilum TaxID=223376 RepID=A0ABR3WNM4_9PEZI
MAPFRIAVLECDTPIDVIRAHHGTYGNIIKRLMEASLQESPAAGADIEPVFSSWDVVEARQYPEVDEVDALFLSGSKHNSFEDADWILQLCHFIRTFYETHKPIVGVCFGHQIVARALGARVQRNPGGWEIAVNTIHLSDGGKELFGRESLQLHQMHRDAVLSLPAGLQNLGYSANCGIQGLYQEKRVLTVQAHPEFDEFVMSHLLRARHELGVFDDEMFEEAFSRADLAHDGLFVAAVIWRFLLERPSY